MISFLSRQWFLLALCAGVGLAILFPHQTGQATDWLPTRVSIMGALFLMAFTLPARSLAEEMVRPWATLWATAISFGLVPLGAWLMGGWLEPVDLAIGTIIMASGPCTLASATLWTRLAGGHDATALFVTVLTTATSWLITPLWLAAATGLAASLPVGQMMLELLVSLVLPVLAGQAARIAPKLSHIANRHKTFFGAWAQVLILIVIFKAAARMGHELAGGSAAVDGIALLLTAVLNIGLHLSALVVGLWTSRGLGLDRPRQIAVAFAASQKTMPVAILLLDKYFRQDFPFAVAPILIYHVGQLILDTAIARWLKHGDSAAAAATTPTVDQLPAVAEVPAVPEAKTKP